MEDEFQKRQVLCYSNFMKYIISFSLFNILLIIENCSIIYSVDIMLGKDNILKELLTPFYFLSPHLYVEILNEKLPNQCFSIFQFNTTSENNKNDDDNDNNNKDIIINPNNINDKLSMKNFQNYEEQKYKKYNRKKNKLKKYYSAKNKQKQYHKRLLENSDMSEISDTIINSLNITNNCDATNDTNETKESTIEQNPLEEMYERIIEEPYFDIKFQGHLLYRLDNSYCVYNKNLIYISYAIVILLLILLVLLFFLNTRKYQTLPYKIAGYIITNLINIIIRPFFIAIVTLLVNRPLLYLYRSTYMADDYKIEEFIYMLLSLIMLILFIVLTYLLHDFDVC